MSQVGSLPKYTREEMNRHAKRALIAATVGTMIEWYDFYLYGLVSALIFGKLFFPMNDPYSSTLLSLSTFALGFVVRPIGAAFFGHFGDKIGRKATLISTLLLMGVSTILIGLVPTYAAIGIWGGVAVTILRIMQGLGVGGEWGGSIAVATEWSTFNKRRGLAGSWPQFGSPLGLLTAVLVLTITSKMGSAEWFESIGWRIPFLLSMILIGVGYYIRTGVLETPIFEEMKRTNVIVRAPVTAVLVNHWREVLLTCMIRMGQHAPFTLFTTFLLSYGTTSLHLTKEFLFNTVLAASCVSLITTPLFGFLSDKFGRKRMYVIGAVTMMLFAFPYYAMINSMVPALVVLAVMLSLPVHDMQYGPQAAFIAESFPANMRYSGSSLGYQFAAAISGGPAPLIAAWLLHTYESTTAISWYIVVVAAISTISALLLPDRSRQDYAASDCRETSEFEPALRSEVAST